MNYYIVIEGELGAKSIYERWIKYVNRNLILIHKVNDFDNNNYFIVSGGGYPSYKRRIEDGIFDVNNLEKVDRFVLIVDSEEMSYTKKMEEITEILLPLSCRVPISIIIQNFCFETWALGNRKISSSNNVSEKVNLYKSVFNVNQYDPEKLPRYRDYNRAQFAYLYLKELINCKYKNLTYTKRNTQTMWDFNFFFQVKKRYDSGHIKSFRSFLETFSQ